MIKILTNEYMEGNQAVKTVKITFLYITIFKYKKLTTNNMAVDLLTPSEQPKKVKGFYET